METGKIKYIPPEIEGSVPGDIQSQADIAAGNQSVWKVEVIQTHFDPSANKSEYEVKIYHTPAILKSEDQINSDQQ